MSELLRWDELPAGGTLRPEEAERPHTGGWRTGVRPEVDLARCVDCLLCWLYCPDSAIVLDGTALSGVDLDFCKGCELCSVVCPTGAITMVADE
ncbi:MAG TPA: 4Fe-4S dicluster-binding protein [Gaiellaceae bacterium]|nr:4Fe-4S dicluster-binding protein [Gaiellaceae bacterium]